MYKEKKSGNKKAPLTKTEHEQSDKLDCSELALKFEHTLQNVWSLVDSGIIQTNFLIHWSSKNRIKTFEMNFIQSSKW